MPNAYLPGEAVKILEEYFKKDEYIGGRMSELVGKTRLKEGQITSWFARARQKSKKAAEEETQREQNRNTIADLREQLKASHAHNESLRAENENLMMVNELLHGGDGPDDGGGGAMSLDLGELLQKELGPTVSNSAAHEFPEFSSGGSSSALDSAH